LLTEHFSHYAIQDRSDGASGDQRLAGDGARRRALRRLCGQLLARVDADLGGQGSPPRR
jgi:hypothetical protein